MSPTLSILIGSLHERLGMLNRLQNILRPQLGPPVEVLVRTDGGEESIGRKRQRLLEAARGEYVAFVDDDDTVSANYVALIIAAVASKPDVVGITGIYHENGLRKKPFIHTIACEAWHETRQAYMRYPNHLNPVRREHALAVGFADMNHGEDRHYADLLKTAGLCKTQVAIDPPIYNYLYNHKTSRSKK